MKISRFPSPNRAILLGAVLTACGALSSGPLLAAGLAGDTIAGYLSLPWSPGSGNYFTQDASGYPTSSLPVYAVVGLGIEFGYYPAQTSTFSWKITVNVGDSRIAINESLSDPNPGYWLGEFTSWTLTISDLDWAGAAGIGSYSYVSQDSNITVQAYDAHSVTFGIGELVVYPTGPYVISRTTIIELAPVPEPCWAALAIGFLTAITWRKWR